MLYAKIQDNQIVSVNNRPNWYSSDGLKVSDETLRKSGYYPVDLESDIPEIDNFYQSIIQKPFSEWTIHGTYVTVRYAIKSLTIEEKKQECLIKVKQWFTNKINSGYDCEAFSNVKINCSRDDLSNMISLKDIMIIQNLSETQFRIYDNTFITITNNQLDEAINELKLFGYNLYQEKWQKENDINSCSSMEDLKNLMSTMEL